MKRAVVVLAVLLLLVTACDTKDLVLSPKDGAIVAEDHVTVTGHLPQYAKKGGTLVVNGTTGAIGSDGTWSVEISVSTTSYVTPVEAIYTDPDGKEWRQRQSIVHGPKLDEGQTSPERRRDALHEQRPRRARPGRQGPGRRCVRHRQPAAVAEPDHRPAGRPAHPRHHRQRLRGRRRVGGPVRGQHHLGRGHPHHAQGPVRRCRAQHPRRRPHQPRLLARAQDPDHHHRRHVRPLPQRRRPVQGRREPRGIAHRGRPRTSATSSSPASATATRS